MRFAAACPVARRAPKQVPEQPSANRCVAPCSLFVPAATFGLPCPRDPGACHDGAGCRARSLGRHGEPWPVRSVFSLKAGKLEKCSQRLVFWRLLRAKTCFRHNIMDTLGIEPRASRMLSGCDTITPCTLLPAGFGCFRGGAGPRGRARRGPVARRPWASALASAPPPRETSGREMGFGQTARE